MRFFQEKDLNNNVYKYCIAYLEKHQWYMLNDVYLNYKTDICLPLERFKPQ